MEADLEAALEAEAYAEQAASAAAAEQAELDALIAGDDGLGWIDEAEDVEPFSDEELRIDPLPPTEEEIDASMLQTVTHLNGTLSTFAYEGARDERVALSQAKAEARRLGDKVATGKAQAEEQWRKEREDKDRLRSLQRELGACEEELARLQHVGERDPNVIAQQEQLELCERVGAEMLAQQEKHGATEKEARAVQLALDSAMLDQQQALKALSALLPVEAKQARTARVSAPHRAQQEREAAQREADAAAASRARAAAAQQERETVAEKQLSAARAGHKKAIATLNARTRLVTEQDADIQEAQRKLIEKRAAAVLQLKASTEAAQAKVKTANERKYEKRRALERAQESEKITILAAGGNPYQVFREREEQARLRMEKQRIERQLADNMAAMQQRMLKQGEQENKRREEERRHKQAAEAAALAVTSMGAQQRDDNFMRKVTKSHSTVLDPTSQIKNLHPSKHTTIKDWKFGLGLGKDPDIIDMMARKYPQVADTFGDPEAAALAALNEEHSRKSKAAGVVGGSLPAPRSSSVQAMAAEAQERGEVVDEMVAADTLGLWEVEGEEGKERKQLGGRQLSVLETRYMAEARERQRTNLFVKQVVGGKEWVGAPFLAKPGVLEFKDFTVGETYNLRFMLTNVSYTFNMFRQEPLPEEVRSFFELTHTPPGRMSAGVSAPLNLCFTPKLDKDVEFDLPLMCQTGRMTIPVRALCKKVVLTMAPPSKALDFAGVVLGEGHTLPFVVRNDGALPSTYTLRLVQGSHPKEEPATSNLLAASRELLPKEEEIFTFPLTGVLPPYSSTEIPITYRPRNPGNSLGMLELTFDGVGPNAAAAPMEMSVYGEGVKVPIYVQREQLDLRACVFGALFRDELVLCNRGKTALKVSLRVPPELHGNLEFVPSMGFVQAKANFNVQLKLRSAEDLLLRCRQFVTDDVLEIPIRVLVPDQALPVYFVLRAQLTTSDLVFTVNGAETAQLDFGACPLNASRAIAVAIYNPSALPQRLGFLPLPKELDVQPGDGLGSILPGETLTREVVFSPSAGTRHKLELTCRTTLNRTYKIKCVGRGIEPTLVLSTTRLKLAATAEGDTTRADVVVRNASRVVRHFQLDVPGGSEATGVLKVSPLVAKLQPGESTRVLVEYTAPSKPPEPEPEPEPEAEGEGGAEGEGEGEGEGGEGGEGGEAEGEAAVEAEGEGGEGEGEGGEGEGGEGEGEGEGGGEEAEPAEEEAAAEAEPPEPWSVHQDLKLACFVKGDGQPYDPEQTLYIGVETVAIEAALLLGNGAVRQTHQYGAVPVGQLRTTTVMVRNCTAREVQLVAQPLDPTGPFSLLDALPLLAPHACAELQLRFLPIKEFAFEEPLVISGLGCELRTTLQGRGVAPTLEVGKTDDGPEVPVVELGGEAATTLLHLGDALVGDEVQGSVEIRNTSQFALRFQLVRVAGGHANLGPLPPLDASPCEATIQAGEAQRLSVRFAPDHAGEHYFELLKVEVPNQKGGQLLMLRGRAWPSAGYVLAPEQQLGPGGLEREALLVAPPQDLVELPPPPDAATGGAAGEARLIELDLEPADDGAPGTMTLVVGNLKPASPADLPDVKPAALEFSFEGLSDDASRRGFSIDPPKASVNPGETKEVTLSFAPNPDAVRGSELGVIASFGVSQWAEASVKCVLKGGSPAPEQPEIAIKLRGRVSASIMDSASPTEGGAAPPTKGKK